ncbi:MAG: cobyrinate a,c-diamide synthase [Spongiibacteraceae bacterium]
MKANCPALFISGIASGQGKTTITAALARYHTNQGRHVRVFKTGPDYLDPKILEIACGHPVEQLDLWMAGKAYCGEQLYLAAKEADLILVEGAMGLLDGDPSSADLAAMFGIPVAVVINAKGMAQTIAPLAYGLANYRKDFEFAGMIANNLGSERHADLIKEAIPDDIPILATLFRDERVVLPERHLGLVEPEDQDDLVQRLDAAAEWIAASDLAKLPKPIEFEIHQTLSPEPLLKGKTIAIAKDGAFSFIYAVNIRLLESMGAELVYFSPLNDEAVPTADAVWLPGGYPELHVKKLSINSMAKASIEQHYLSGKPMLAECGGMLYLQETLTNINGEPYPMTGLIPGHGALKQKRGCQGMQTAVLPEGDVRAHAHHRVRSEGTIEPIAHGRRQRHPAPGEAIYRSKGLTASFLHLFFPSNPEAIAMIFNGEMIDA